MLLGALVVGVRMKLTQRRSLGAAQARMRPVLRGQIAEQLAPHLAPDFVWSAADARFLGGPIDYVVFDGYSDGGEVELVLVEVETGRSQLTAGQRRVRRTIKTNHVRWATIRL